MELAEVKFKRAHRVEARPASPDDDIRLETDGELPGKLPAVFEIEPAALRFRIPENA